MVCPAFLARRKGLPRNTFQFLPIQVLVMWSL
jgi:hypothetical protein